LLIGSAHVVCRGSPRFNPFYSSWICSRAGEIRGGEAFDLLQLLNTGHNGTISTVHANSAAQGISRFTSCVLQSGVGIPYRAIKTNIADSLNAIIQIERQPGTRFVSEVLEIHGYEPEADRYHLYPVYGQSGKMPTMGIDPGDGAKGMRKLPKTLKPTVRSASLPTHQGVGGIRE